MIDKQDILEGIAGPIKRPIIVSSPCVMMIRTMELMKIFELYLMYFLAIFLSKSKEGKNGEYAKNIITIIACSII